MLILKLLNDIKGLDISAFIFSFLRYPFSLFLSISKSKLSFSNFIWSGFILILILFEFLINISLST